MNRMDFVRHWANYVRTHTDEDWSAQQALLINSMIKSSQQMMTRELYLKMKDAKRCCSKNRKPLPSGRRHTSRINYTPRINDI